MLHDVKRLIGRLFGDRSGRRRAAPPPPAFDESVIFAHLREPAAAAEAWHAGRREAAWVRLTEHFERRVPPLGFVTPEAVPALFDEAQRRFPVWRARLLEKVREDREEGLAVYDRRAAPLSQSFDWSAPCGPGLEDRLYDARPHRLGFLPRWAMACHYDRSLVAELEQVLAGWMAAAELPGGHPGFRSSHVVVYQLIACLLAWPFLASLDDEAGDGALPSLKRRVLQSLYECSLYMRRVDASGVGNNHRLAERLADWLTAALLPEFDHAADRQAAESLWLEELHRQTYDDGGSFEHSVHYHEHGCELAVIYLLLSRRNGWPVPPASRERIEKMLRFQLAMAGPDLLPLAIGNTTEDPLLPLGVGGGWQCGLLREVQRACFVPTGPAAPDHDPTREAAYWLLEGELAPPGTAIPGEAPFQDFPDSGFCVLAEPVRQVRVVFRLGPTPAAPGIGGHSHGDLLSLCLSAGGEPVLAAPGTGRYRFRVQEDLPGQPNLRAHFASAASRSGFYIEGLEPYGSLKGDFRNWTLPCQVEARRASATAAGLSWIEGEVVGEGPYVGQRRGVVHLWEGGWLVYDRPPLKPGGRAFLGWQFAPGVDCQVDTQGRVALCGAAPATELQMLAEGVGEADVVSGGFQPFRGWVSPSYGRLEAAANLRFALPQGSHGAATFLSLDSRRDARLEQLLEADDGLVFRVTVADEELLILLNTRERGGAVRWQDVDFEGRVVCLWRHAGGLTVRALGLLRLRAPSLAPALSAETAADFELRLGRDGLRWPRGTCAALTVEGLSDES
jgi:hypothetical protein